MIGGADPSHGGDVGEFADGCVRDIGKAVAIGVGFEGGVQDPAGMADFGVGAERGIPDFAAGVKKGLRGG